MAVLLASRSVQWADDAPAEIMMVSHSMHWSVRPMVLLLELMWNSEWQHEQNQKHHHDHEDNCYCLLWFS